MIRQGFLSSVILLFAFAFGCGSQKPLKAVPVETVPEKNKTLHIKGSDTMVPLVSRWAESYMKGHPEVAVYVQGGGSGAGIEALIKGRVDICASSRPMNAQEIKQLYETRGSLGISVMCARDALSIYLNSENPVSDLSMSQLRDIFTGKIRNWREVGGENRPIQVVHRQPNSGTRQFLAEHLLLAESFGESGKTVPTTSAVINQVKASQGAIGYGGIAWAQGVTQCHISGIAPTVINVNQGLYPLARYLYFYTSGKPEGRLRHFIDQTLTPEGQRLAVGAGFVPLFVPDDTFD